MHSKLNSLELAEVECPSVSDLPADSIKELRAHVKPIERHFSSDSYLPLFLSKAFT
jgi:hypothetical protein